MKHSLNALQFSLFRIAMGSYLLFHFAYSLPYSGVLFSNEGMIQTPSINPTYGLSPISFLNWFDSARTVAALHWVLILASAGLIFGFKRRWLAAVLLYGWIALFNRN